MSGDAAVGSDAWLAARSTAGRPYAGEAHLIDVVVSADKAGDAVTYHVALEDGAPPQYRAGAAPGGAAATLEMTRTEAEHHERGDYSTVVAYMRGSTKTKGATRPLLELFRLID